MHTSPRNAFAYSKSKIRWQYRSLVLRKLMWIRYARVSQMTVLKRRKTLTFFARMKMLLQWLKVLIKFTRAERPIQRISQSNSTKTPSLLSWAVTIPLIHSCLLKIASWFRKDMCHKTYSVLVALNPASFCPTFWRAKFGKISKTVCDSYPRQPNFPISYLGPQVNHIKLSTYLR